MTDAKAAKLGLTPSATVGPYFAYALTPANYPFRAQFSNTLQSPDIAGEKIRIEGRVTDGDGNGISDAMIEIWQANAAGRYAHAADAGALPNTGFKGFGRAETSADGSFAFDTIKPGAVVGPKGMQAPHIVVAVFARGMLRHLYTRIYFADEAATAHDAVLALVPAGRRPTLIAQRSAKASGPDRSGAIYRFDIRSQGVDETVFFDL
jgi:protocatechuate 3,4-dioxygenase, alpha subunit